MQKRLASTQRLAAAAAILAVTLTGCSEAQDAADKAKAKASEAAAAKASEAAAQAKEKASDAAGKLNDKATEMGGDKAGALVDDVLGKLSPEQQEKLQGLDAVALGEKGALAEDADSLTVAEFFAARQSAAATGGEDLSALEAVTGPRVFKRASRYVVRNSGKDIPFVVNVVAAEAGSVDVCVGPKGKKSRTLTVTDGKVVKNIAGDHTC
ncbi:hypothetical protein [Nocardioides cavernaquae]|uniref:Lipoprotein n=1 Tax=Nocardioides cavernaquae TaxID=2321396 RepID=A0A3A5H995_9ACTN|nr:hypothetical protein [Nocardioides cavernaquae]RJS47186.1 hypothetical protein D4739_13770 [Nocardioides cavernaquae]